MTEYVYLTPDVPPALLEPVRVAPRKLVTLGDLAEDRTAQKAAADTNADKIVSIGCILEAAKKGATAPPDTCFSASG